MVNKTKRNAIFYKNKLRHFTWIKVTKIKSLQTFYFFKRARVRLSAKLMIILVEKTLIIFGHAVIIYIIFKSL